MTNSLALVADWNATPHDGGRWSPSWVAARGGLRIHSAGPGRHGDIDYLMADCHVYGAERHAPPLGATRSDHDVISWTLYDPEAPGDRWLTLASWNLRYGRPPAQVRAQVARVLSDLDPDILALQEAADYHRELRTLAEMRGYRLVAWSGPGRGHNVLMVRAGLRLRRPRLIKLSPRGWRLVGGRGSHRELYAASCAVEWLRVVNLHMPPSVNWTRGVIHGPPMRVAAYAHAAGRCVRLAMRHRRKRS